MRFTSFLLLAFLFFSCTREPSVLFDEDELFPNPLDSGAVEYDLPALTFFPNEITTSYGQIFSVEVFAMGYENLAGSFVVFEYDPNRVEVSSILQGSIFGDETNAPIFFFENNTENGLISISTAFLGSDSIAVSTLGSIAQIEFTATATGQARLEFTDQSEMVDPNDEILPIQGYGEAIINIQ